MHTYSRLSGCFPRPREEEVIYQPFEPWVRTVALKNHGMHILHMLLRPALMRKTTLRRRNVVLRIRRQKLNGLKHKRRRRSQPNRKGCWESLRDP